jgi:hypothetical protein
MPLGAGLAPAGTSQAGFGVPDTAAVAVDAILPDPVTGFAQTGRYLNFTLGDYAFTADGRLQGQSTVSQLVTLALTEVRGSSAIPTLGQTFTKIQEQGANVQQQLTSAVRQALADLIKRNFVKLTNVAITPISTAQGTNPDGQRILVQWVDLTTGQPQTTPIGP